MTVQANNQIADDERRRSSRHACNLQAAIRVGGAKVMDCIVKDISYDGAKLIVPAGSWLPSNFSIELPDGYPSLLASRVWEAKDCMGVQFVKASKAGNFMN